MPAPPPPAAPPAEDWTAAAFGSQPLPEQWMTEAGAEPAAANDWSLAAFADAPDPNLEVTAAPAADDVLSGLWTDDELLTARRTPEQYAEATVEPIDLFGEATPNDVLSSAQFTEDLLFDAPSVTPTSALPNTGMLFAGLTFEDRLDAADQAADADTLYPDLYADEPMASSADPFAYRSAKPAAAELEVNWLSDDLFAETDQMTAPPAIQPEPAPVANEFTAEPAAVDALDDLYLDLTDEDLADSQSTYLDPALSLLDEADDLSRVEPLPAPITTNLPSAARLSVDRAGAEAADDFAWLTADDGADPPPSPIPFGAGSGSAADDDELPSPDDLFGGFATEYPPRTPAEPAAPSQSGGDALAAKVRRGAHEINNPLGIIKNYLAILKIKLGDEAPIADELRIMHEELDRIVRIMRGLVQDEAPAGSLIEPTDVNALIEDLVKVTDPSWLSRGVRIVLALDPALPLLPCDRDKLKQIVLNLLLNALESTPEGGSVRLETNTLVNHRQEKFVEILVADSGSGIPAELADRVFSPVESAKGGSHAGLGLSIVKALTQALHGSITFKSHATGTTFQLSFPTATEAPPAENP